MSSELVIKDIDKIYAPRGKAPVHAVRKLSLAAKPGEIVALLGSSGCGKTSTLRMIAGFEDVSNGTIALDGRAIHSLAPAQRGVAMAFEAYSLYPPLTIGENISFALKSTKLAGGEAEKRVKDMAEMLDIADILGRYPSSVSGGQQQRASLGRALVRRAPLTLLDEPMGQLEPQLRAILRGRIKHYLRENNLTSILVTHDQTEANALADRIAVMEGGELQQYATPKELKEKPANLFTGTFIGEPPMNVFPARATVSAKQVRLTLEGGDMALAYPVSDFATPVVKLLQNMGAVTLGVRPHGLHIGEGTLNGRVLTVQWLGDQTHVATGIAGRTAVSVAHERPAIKAGDKVTLGVAAKDLHLFDPETGAAIAHGGALA
jgi:multiple sugar transport system ATP-binding protein